MQLPEWEVCTSLAAPLLTQGCGQGSHTWQAQQSLPQTGICAVMNHRTMQDVRLATPWVHRTA